MITVNDKQLLIDSVFSGGELNIKLPDLDLKKGDIVKIDCRGVDPTNLLKIGLVVNAIRNNYMYLNPEVQLHIPYFPYARQDRVCRFGEVYGLEFAMDYLHNLNLAKISTCDVHSDIFFKIRSDKQYSEMVSYCYIDSISYIQNIFSVLGNKTNLIVVLPDSGSVLRHSNTKSELKNYGCRYGDMYGSSLGGILGESINWIKKLPNPLKCNKNREQSKVISEINVSDNLLELSNNFNLDFLIVDDICDGGATFISTVDALKKALPHLFSRGKVDITLFVTHGIFRNGTDALYDSGITRIITTDSIPQNLSNHKGDFNVFKI